MAYLIFRNIKMYETHGDDFCRQDWKPIEAVSPESEVDERKTTENVWLNTVDDLLDGTSWSLEHNRHFIKNFNI